MPENKFSVNNNGNDIDICYGGKIIANIHKKNGKTHYVTHADIPGLKEFLVQEFPKEMTEIWGAHSARIIQD